MNSLKTNTQKQYYENAWQHWEDMKSFGPSSRHVRRLSQKIIKTLQFNSILDAGCGAGTLLQDISSHFPHVQLNGAEYAESGVRLARKKNPNARIYQLDLEKRALKRKFDLVTCIDVLEHIREDERAISNLRKMTNKYLLVVVPTGPLFEQERVNVGHIHGYNRKEINDKLAASGFKIVKSMAWGFPLYNIYRRLVMNMPEESIGGQFGNKKKFISQVVYWLLFLNLPFGGERYYVLCEV
jgi:SAM-dependent methyltransferase